MRKVGVGGMSAVYLGRDEVLGRETSYIVLEECVPGYLKGLMDREGPIPGGTLSRVGADVAAGLAHRRGGVHRDVKPQSIPIDEYGVPKLADFGIARAFDATTPTMRRARARNLGTAL